MRRKAVRRTVRFCAAAAKLASTRERRNEGRIAAKGSTQGRGAVDDQVEAPVVVGGDAWRSGADEPLLGHHVSLGPTASSATLHQARSTSLARLARRPVRGHAGVWSPNASARRPHPGSEALPQRLGASGSGSRSLTRSALFRACARCGGSLGMAWSHARHADRPRNARARGKEMAEKAAERASEEKVPCT